MELLSILKETKIQDKNIEWNNNKNKSITSMETNHKTSVSNKNSNIANLFEGF